MATPTSSSSAAAGNGTAKTSGKRKKVASAAGAARYHKPIGSEIGGPRDANHAAIQNDQGARKNYGDLINGDGEAQRKALDGMSVEDLNKLADIAFSFKSSDPKVVALRIAARNAQARKGIRVPVGQTQTKGGAPAKPGSKPMARKPAPKKKAAPAKKAAPPPAAPRNMGRVRAMAGADSASRRLVELSNAKAEADKRAGRGTTSSGSFPVNSPKQVRDAQRAIGRAKPEHRPAIARHIIAQAKKLNCSHMISDATAHYARGERRPGSINMARTGSAVELAGKWKHGYIPLDATAMASKMKGGKGKPWWDGPGHSSAGGSAKKALHGSPKSGSSGKELAPRTAPAPAKQGFLSSLASPAEKRAAARAAARGEGSTVPKETAKAYRDRKVAESVKNGGSGWTFDRMSESERKDYAGLKGGNKTTNILMGSEYQQAREDGNTHAEAMAAAERVAKVQPTNRSIKAEKKSDRDVRSQLATKRSAESSGKLTNVVKSGSAASEPRGAAVKSNVVRPRAEAHHAPGSAVAVQVPGKLSKQPGTVQGHDAQGGLIVKWADSTGKGHTDTFDPAEVYPRTVRTAKVDKTPPRPVQNRHSPDQVDHVRTGAVQINAKHDAAVRKAKAEGTTPPKFPYHEVEALKQSDIRNKDEKRIAARIASGKGKSTQGVLSPSEKSQIQALQRSGKQKEAGALAHKSLTASKARIAKLVAKSKPRVGTTSATDVNKVSTASPAVLAQRYVQMHGDAGARKKIAQMEARKRLSPADRAVLAALKAAVSGKA